MTLTALEARTMLEEHGFALERIVNGLCWQIDNKSKHSANGVGAPIGVLYRSVVYAVSEDRGPKWLLQSLDNGRRLEIAKSECRPWEPELPEIEDARPTVTEEANPMNPMIVAPQRDPNDDTPTIRMSFQSKGELVRLTRMHLDTLLIQRENIIKQLVPINKQIEITKDMLRNLGVEIATPQPITHTKRQANPNSSVNVPQAVKDKIRDAWIFLGKPTNYGYLPKTKQKAKDMGVDIDAIPEWRWTHIMKEIRENDNRID